MRHIGASPSRLTVLTLILGLVLVLAGCGSTAETVQRAASTAERAAQGAASTAERAAQGAASTADHPDWKTYSNDVVTFRYPPTMATVDAGVPNHIAVRDNNVSVIIWQLDEGKKAAFWNADLRTWAEQEPTALSGYVEEDARYTDTTLGGLDALLITYERPGQLHRRYMISGEPPREVIAEVYASNADDPRAPDMAEGKATLDDILATVSFK